VPVRITVVSLISTARRPLQDQVVDSNALIRQPVISYLCNNKVKGKKVNGPITLIHNVPHASVKALLFCLTIFMKVSFCVF